MNAEQLLRQFDRLAETPDAVARLRKYIVELAVRGKLIPQNDADEPAVSLLQRINEERVRQRGTSRLHAEPGNPVAPFDLPPTWAWTTIGTVFCYDAGIKREPGALPPALWLLELEDVEKDTGRVLQRLSVRDRGPQSTKSEFRTGDILYGKLRAYLNKVVVADVPGCSTTEIVALRPYVSMCPKYCALALRRPDHVDYVTRLGQGTKMPRLRSEDALVASFPLPPLAEQHRIVAKCVFRPIVTGDFGIVTARFGGT